MKAPVLKRLPIVAVCALFGGTVAANASPYEVTMDEVGANVVATGSGNIDLTGLTFITGITDAALVDPFGGLIILGQSPSTPNVDIFRGPISGPLTFGSGFAKSADSASGNVTFSDGTASIGVPPGYISDSPLGTSTDTWNSASFLTLHVTPGIYEWTWGNGADQSFTLCAGVACPVAPATPLPATLPLFASGLGALGLLARRRKRRAQTVG